MIEWVECADCRFIFFPERPGTRYCEACECRHESGDGTNETDVIAVLEGIK